MAKTPPNSNKRWARSDDAALRKLAKGNTPTGLIAYKLGRSENAIYSRASDLNVSLQPPNRPPYTRRKK
jgi:hypothetical protein